MQMLLSATTILVLFAYAQEQIDKFPTTWAPFVAMEAGLRD
ncbi:hypothetical protein [Tabrizicola sp.]